MASEFKLGATTGIYDFLTLDVLLPNAGIPNDPDWSHQPYATSVRAGNGQMIGQGFPVVKWRWQHLSNEHRAILRTLCPGLSAAVSIRTPTNELDVYGDMVYQAYDCIMNWPDTDEDKVADQTLGIVLIFTHCVEVVE